MTLDLVVKFQILKFGSTVGMYDPSEDLQVVYMIPLKVSHIFVDQYGSYKDLQIVDTNHIWRSTTIFVEVFRSVIKFFNPILCHFIYCPDPYINVLEPQFTHFY